ncbi:MAG: TldD/PmbA family protein [Bacteroidales bacterium]|nr:TldD/PmbA family protein [Bacteroidales bacterium]
MIHPEQHYLDIFQVDVPRMDALVAEALRHGGDYCDLYFENTTYGNLVLRDGAVTSGGQHVDFGVGVRVLSGEKTGYAYSESTAMADMLSCARAASAIADGTSAFYEHSVRADANGSRMVGRRFRGAPNPAADRYPVRLHWRGTEASVLIPYLQKLESAIRARDTRVVKVIGVIAWQVTDVLMYNSLKECKYETRPMGAFSATVIFAQDGKVENKTVSRSFRTGVEMLTDDLVREMADQAVKGIDERFDARRPKGGQMPVVMGAGASGILLHEAMGHAFEADFNRKGTSIFSDRMGQRVCPEGIQIIDDGTLKGNRGALNFDDEGVPGQKTCMVEDGILTSYLHDRISARHYGVSPTGNGRRESFRYAPIPRMRATYMESGTASPADIIASVSKGIYVDEFSNGQVKIGEGDFTFFVKSGFLIEDGRLTAPVKDINIIGNGPEALRDVLAVGDDLAIDPGTWTCGKEQSVPVSCGIPTVLIKNLTVGGE